jgi:hypothetical protein
MNILLGQLGAFGDGLYATILARQLRHDHPDAHITWAIAERYQGAAYNNPHIDEIWVFPINNTAPFLPLCGVFEHEAMKRRGSGEFDRVVYSQIYPDNFQNYDGTIRPSILRAYGAPITVPVENVLVLSAAELERVNAYAARQNLMDYRYRILFECSSTSGQSFVTPAYAERVAALVHAVLPRAVFMLSTNLPLSPDLPNTKSAGSLSPREIAALTGFSTLFVGCGSGCTVAATSTAATSLPMIQILSAHTSVYASFAHDFAHYGFSNEHILEMTDENPETAAAAIMTACEAGIAEARRRYHQEPIVSFEFYATLIARHLLAENRFIDAARSVMAAAARYGWRKDLFVFGMQYIAPHLGNDAQLARPDGRRDAERFLAALNENVTTLQ